MAFSMRLSFVLCLLLPLFVLPSSAQTQNCVGETFSQNRIYSLCTPLSELGATLHWTYHPSNGTVDIAYRIAQDSSSWVAWAINPSSSGMLGANAIFAFHDSSGVVTTISSIISSSSYSPTIKDESLSFTVYSKDAEYSNNMYTIFASLQLPSNETTQNTVWQAGADFSNGLPSGHDQTGQHTLSKTSLNFLSGSAVSTGSNSKLHRKNIHGVLNAVSWGLILPLGVMSARYLRVFKSADPVWFYLHIACQCSGYILGVAGWGLGLKLGSESKGITYHTHRNIGIVLFLLATLQVLAVLLRPNKDNKYRFYWNIYHHSVGYAVILLSIINIFKGFNILNPAHKWKNAYIATLVILACIYLVLEVITWIIVLKRRRSSQKLQIGANGANVYGVRQQPVV
ncbi:cytochrome b561 and DOMON domain-containing protein At5g47530-like [Typha angustifolia]|uniref:cytochrome b561 and DOMON domain-containing protein At5g47530-like n=1 Tax=Typha angustifolia TaxID=59011 RepID=UPI003C2B20A9